MKQFRENALTAPLALLFLLALAAALRIPIASQDLFADELATYWVVSSHGPRGVLETVQSTAEISPPLSFMLTWLTTQIDLSPELVRLPAIVAGLATIPLVYEVGRRSVGREAGILAAALTTLSPFMIFYSAEARGYALVMALVLASTLALLLAVGHGNRRRWVAYGALVCLAAYTHYTAIFVLVAQFAWALWRHPQSRRPLVLATVAAALLYLPWLPSLRGDLDSPTTAILDALSPFNLRAVRLSLSHWALGYPFAGFSELRDLPGVPALLLIAAAIAAGLVSRILGSGAITARSAGLAGSFALIVVLALATPVGEAAQSAIGTNVFSTRSLAPSWPYLALLIAALVVSLPGRARHIAAAALIAGFSISAVKMSGVEVERPPYSEVAAHLGGTEVEVLVDGAAVTPGPLTNFELEGSDPGIPVARLNVPAQRLSPFDFADRRRPPAAVAKRALAKSQDGPIALLVPAGSGSLGGLPSRRPLADEFIAALSGYELSDRRTFPGLISLELSVYERGPRRDGS